MYEHNLCLYSIMASTRRKNNQAEYNLQVKGNEEIVDNRTSKMRGYQDPTYYAGKGLIQGHLPDSTLSYNPTDTESFLLGIGANNFINPQPTFEAKTKHLQSLSMMDNTVPMVMPKELKPLPNQRPFPTP